MSKTITHVIYVMASKGACPSPSIVSRILDIISPAPAVPAPEAEMPISFERMLPPPEGMEDNLNWRFTYWGVLKGPEKVRVALHPDCLRLEFVTGDDIAMRWCEELAQKIVDLAEPGDLEIYAVGHDPHAARTWFGRHLGGGSFGFLPGWDQGDDVADIEKLDLAKALILMTSPDTVAQGASAPRQSFSSLIHIYDDVL